MQCSQNVFHIHNKYSCEQKHFVFFKEHFLENYYYDWFYNSTVTQQCIESCFLSFFHYLILRQGMICVILHSELLSRQICKLQHIRATLF